MASGYYPLDRSSGGGRALEAISDRLGKLIATRHDAYGRAEESLPATWDCNTPEDAAADGVYEAYLELAHELIERCLTKRPTPTGAA